ncbi:methyl-accepting chemotaxis protein, partial [Pseudoalteromonas phenolica]
EKSDAVVSEVVEQAKAEIKENVDKTQMLAIGVFVVAGIIVMTLVLSTSRSIIQPVERVYQTIERIRRENNLSLQIEQSGNDEITIMTRDFNSLISDFRDLIADVNGELATINEATDHLTETTAQ